MFNLTGKKALVTGSTQGIGFEIAKILSEHGATVFINGVSSIEKIKAASDQIPNSVPVQSDVSDFEKIYEATGDVDILILNASIQFKKQWNEFSIDDYDAQMNCNLKSSYFLIKKYAESMKKKGWGRIVTIGSVNQYNNHPELLIYGMTKAAQMKMVEGIAPHLEPFGVTINNVGRGVISTPRNEEVLNNPELNAKVMSKVPCGYAGEPKDVSPAVLLLCSDEGRYITGSEIIIDGGMRL